MPLFLLRHGETVFNVAGRFQGQNNSDLTQLGKQQAHKNGQLLGSMIENVAGIHFVSSPLGRTLATSEIICKSLGISIDTINTDERIMEMNFGAWQGMTEFEIDEEFPGEWDKRSANPATFTPPGAGESYNDLFDRVDSWLDETRDYWENGAIWVAVSHGGTGAVIRGRYLGLDVGQIRALARPHDEFYELSLGQVKSHGTDKEAVPIN